LVRHSTESLHNYGPTISRSTRQDFANFELSEDISPPMTIITQPDEETTWLAIIDGELASTDSNHRPRDQGQDQNPSREPS
jgi:hypothetical protein